MSSWLIPANTKFYDVFAAFDQPETYWPVNAKLSTGDIVFVYLAAPYKQIAFRCEVLATGFSLKEIRDQVQPFIKGSVESDAPDKKKFMKLKPIGTAPIEPEGSLSLNKLRESGLNGMLMGARKLENNPVLFAYITKAFA